MPQSRIKVIVTIFVMASLIAAGVLTRQVTGARELGTFDRSLIFMQRMGAPPTLINLYQALEANTVTIRGARSDRLISTGLYAGDLAQPRELPGLLQGLPGGVKRFLQAGGSDSDLVYFVAPAAGLTAGSVRVDTPFRQLNGAVIAIDRADGLAAIVAELPAGERAKFYEPLQVDERPSGTLSLRMLILHRDPARYARSTAFVLTSGGVAGGTPDCDTPVHGASAGSPLVYISPAGQIWPPPRSCRSSRFHSPASSGARGGCSRASSKASGNGNCRKTGVTSDGSRWCSPCCSHRRLACSFETSGPARNRPSGCCPTCLAITSTGGTSVW